MVYSLTSVLRGFRKKHSKNNNKNDDEKRKMEIWKVPKNVKKLIIFSINIWLAYVRRS